MTKIPHNGELQIDGEHIVSLSRQQLWESLNDPLFLQACIRHCEELTRIEEDQFEAVIGVRLGPVKKTFDVRLRVVNINPPANYQLRCNVAGGIAGNAQGVADVVLEVIEPSVTRLGYSATVNAEGRLARFGIRRLGGVVERYMQGFFDRMIVQFEGRSGENGEHGSELHRE